MSISNIWHYHRRTGVKRLFEIITFMKDLRCLSVAVFICNSFNSTLSGNSDVARLVAEVEADNWHFSYWNSLPSYLYSTISVFTVRQVTMKILGTPVTGTAIHLLSIYYSARVCLKKFLDHTWTFTSPAWMSAFTTGTYRPFSKADESIFEPRSAPSNVQFCTALHALFGTVGGNCQN